MDDKTSLLKAISAALERGEITPRDIREIADNHSAKNAAGLAKPAESRTSVVDVMFYIAGIVLFAALAVLISQSWDGGIATRILLSAGTGTVFWAVALYLIRSPRQDDVRRGLTNALLLAGSLSLITGGFIIASEFVSYSDFHFYATAITLIFLGGLHISFGWQIKHDLTVLLGILLAAAAFPTFVFGLFTGSDVPMFVYWLILALSSGLLAYAARVASRIGASSPQAAHTLDSLSVFGVFASLYAASFDDSTGIVWLLVLIAGIVGLFYLSIIKQDRIMLGTGSLFLVIAVITVSFRYFSGYGAATSLLISALGLLSTAIVATTINRRYITSA